MVLCYEPIKNMDFLEFKFGKATFLIHSKIIKELTNIKSMGKIKRSKIANLTLEVIDKETKNKNFKYIMDDENENTRPGVRGRVPPNRFNKLFTAAVAIVVTGQSAFTPI